MAEAPTPVTPDEAQQERQEDLTQEEPKITIGEAPEEIRDIFFEASQDDIVRVEYHPQDFQIEDVEEAVRIISAERHGGFGAGQMTSGHRTGFVTTSDGNRFISITPSSGQRDPDVLVQLSSEDNTPLVVYVTGTKPETEVDRAIASIDKNITYSQERNARGKEGQKKIPEDFIRVLTDAKNRLKDRRDQIVEALQESHEARLRVEISDPLVDALIEAQEQNPNANGEKISLAAIDSLLENNELTEEQRETYEFLRSTIQNKEQAVEPSSEAQAEAAEEQIETLGHTITVAVDIHGAQLNATAQIEGNQPGLAQQEGATHEQILNDLLQALQNQERATGGTGSEPEMGGLISSLQELVREMRQQRRQPTQPVYVQAAPAPQPYAYATPAAQPGVAPEVNQRLASVEQALADLRAQVEQNANAEQRQQVHNQAQGLTQAMETALQGLTESMGRLVDAQLEQAGRFEEALQAQQEQIANQGELIEALRAEIRAEAERRNAAVEQRETARAQEQAPDVTRLEEELETLRNERNETAATLQIAELLQNPREYLQEHGINLNENITEEQMRAMTPEILLNLITAAIHQMPEGPERTAAQDVQDRLRNAFETVRNGIPEDQREEVRNLGSIYDFIAPNGGRSIEELRTRLDDLNSNIIQTEQQLAQARASQTEREQPEQQPEQAPAEQNEQASNVATVNENVRNLSQMLELKNEKKMVRGWRETVKNVGEFILNTVAGIGARGAVKAALVPMLGAVGGPAGLVAALAIAGAAGAAANWARGEAKFSLLHRDPHNVWTEVAEPRRFGIFNNRARSEMIDQFDLSARLGRLSRIQNAFRGIPENERPQATLDRLGLTSEQVQQAFTDLVLVNRLTNQAGMDQIELPPNTMFMTNDGERETTSNALRDLNAILPRLMDTNNIEAPDAAELNNTVAEYYGRARRVMRKYDMLKGFGLGVLGGAVAEVFESFIMPEAAKMVETTKEVTELSGNTLSAEDMAKLVESTQSDQIDAIRAAVGAGKISRDDALDLLEKFGGANGIIDSDSESNALISALGRQYKGVASVVKERIENVVEKVPGAGFHTYEDLGFDPDIWTEQNIRAAGMNYGKGPHGMWLDIKGSKDVYEIQMRDTLAKFANAGIQREDLTPQAFMDVYRGAGVADAIAKHGLEPATRVIKETVQTAQALNLTPLGKELETSGEALGKTMWSAGNAAREITTRITEEVPDPAIRSAVARRFTTLSDMVNSPIGLAGVFGGSTAAAMMYAPKAAPDIGGEGEDGGESDGEPREGQEQAPRGEGQAPAQRRAQQQGTGEQPPAREGQQAQQGTGAENAIPGTQPMTHISAGQDRLDRRTGRRRTSQAALPNQVVGEPLGEGGEGLVYDLGDLAQVGSGRYDFLPDQNFGGGRESVRRHIRAQAASRDNIARTIANAIEPTMRQVSILNLNLGDRVTSDNLQFQVDASLRQEQREILREHMSRELRVATTDTVQLAELATREMIGDLIQGVQNRGLRMRREDIRALEKLFSPNVIERMFSRNRLPFSFVDRTLRFAELFNQLADTPDDSPQRNAVVDQIQSEIYRIASLQSENKHASSIETRAMAYVAIELAAQITGIEPRITHDDIVIQQPTRFRTNVQQVIGTVGHHLGLRQEHINNNYQLQSLIQLISLNLVRGLDPSRVTRVSIAGGIGRDVQNTRADGLEPLIEAVLQESGRIRANNTSVQTPPQGRPGQTGHTTARRQAQGPNTGTGTGGQRTQVTGRTQTTTQARTGQAGQGGGARRATGTETERTQQTGETRITRPQTQGTPPSFAPSLYP